MRKVAREDLVRANKEGLKNHALTDYSNYEPCFYRTALLSVANQIGEMGYDIAECPVVRVDRFGHLPENGISWNYAENRNEYGLSCYHGDDPRRSEFVDRDVVKHPYGIKMPFKGSDDETIILVVDKFENMD